MKTSNTLAAIVNIFLPGVGQLVQGRFLAFVFFFVATLIGYFLLVIPGILMHIWCILDSVNYKEKQNTSTSNINKNFWEL